MRRFAWRVGTRRPRVGRLGGGANALQMAALSNAISDPQVAQIGGSTPRTAALPGDIWAARGFDQFGGIDSNGGALGVNYSTGGGAIGADLDPPRR